MLTTYNEIKKELLGDWEEFAEAIYPEDQIAERADSACPVYYNEIIAEWQELPREYEDAWKDGVPISSDTTLYSLMSWDLYEYYREQYQRAFDEIKAEKEEEEND